MKKRKRGIKKGVTNYVILSCIQEDFKFYQLITFTEYSFLSTNLKKISDMSTGQNPKQHIF